MCEACYFTSVPVNNADRTDIMCEACYFTSVPVNNADRTDIMSEACYFTSVPVNNADRTDIMCEACYFTSVPVNNADRTDITCEVILPTCGKHLHDRIHFTEEAPIPLKKMSLIPPPFIEVSIMKVTGHVIVLGLGLGLSMLPLVLRYSDWTLNCSDSLVFLVFHFISKLPFTY
jgi:hypothetical protein